MIFPGAQSPLVLPFSVCIVSPGANIVYECDGRCGLFHWCPGGMGGVVVTFRRV